MSFVLTGLIGYAGFTDMWWLSIVLGPVNAFFAWMATRWVAANISSDGQKLPVTFEGSPWGFIGWFVLVYVSMITIIGWAWVVTAWMRWHLPQHCRHPPRRRFQCKRLGCPVADRAVHPGLHPDHPDTVGVGLACPLVRLPVRACRTRESMTAKSGHRFSEKIMFQELIE